MLRRLAAGLAVAAVAALAACGPAPTPAPSASSPRPTPTPVAVFEGPTLLPPEATPLSVTIDRVTLTVIPRSPSVNAGGEWTVVAGLHNGRDVPVTYGGSPCGFAGLTVTMPIPLEPEGRTWPGSEGAFKSYALTRGNGGGGGPTDPMTSSPIDPTCQAGGTFSELAPSETRTQTITWTAELIGGLDALPGRLDFIVQAGIDPDRTSPPPPPVNGPIGMWFPNFKALAVSGQVMVDAGDQHPISIGQAIDAALGQAGFTGWLAAQPEGTCSTVNVLLTEGQAGSILPVGPNWEIDVICEQGVPRHWLIATVDPFTAEVTGLNRCDVPCDR